MKKLCNYILHILTFVFLISPITFAHAQNDATTTTANNSVNLMRSNGMIYVVVGVIVIILAGLILYLTTIDKKVKRLEDEMKIRN